MAQQQQAPTFKTLLCIDFHNGSCTKGNLCTFAHGDSELRIGKRPTNMQQYQKEKCKNFQTGFCRYGAACYYKHADQVTRCPFYEAAGRCYGGCPFKHPKPRED